jgi:branched-chain amino acid transport system ATP-binding protein
VSLTVEAGEIRSLIGPNGAGKTTLFNAVSGIRAADAGHIAFDATAITRLRADQISRLGIARTFQNVELFSGMTVLDNVLVGLHARAGSGLVGAALALPSARLREATAREEAERALDDVGLRADARRLAGTLPFGRQRLLEVARALAARPRLLLLDEPASGMVAGEAGALIEMLRRLRTERALTIVLVEHNMQVVMDVSDRISVLDAGALLAEGPPAAIARDPRVVEAYLGRETAPEASLPSASVSSRVALRVEGLAASYGPIRALADVGFEVPAGAIVTLLGANGAGKSTTLKTISGLLPPAAGRVTFEERDITGWAPAAVVGAGIEQVPERREIFSDLTVRENLAMGAYMRRDRAAVRSDLARIHETFPVLAERAGQRAGTLSGGEQQMLAMARALMGRPRLLLLDEPSLGLAPLVVQRVFEIITRINAAGMTILLVEQNARMALAISAYGYVLETGRVALAGTRGELLGDDRVRRSYLGTAGPT